MRPYERILEFLANSPQPENKYQIEKRTKLSRNSVYDGIRKLELLEWVKTARVGKARTGMPMRFYELTDLGIFRARVKGLEICKAVLARLSNEKIAAFERRIVRAHVYELNQLVKDIRPIWISRKAAPGYRFMLLMEADDRGRVRTSISAGFPSYTKRRQPCPQVIGD